MQINCGLRRRLQKQQNKIYKTYGDSHPEMQVGVLFMLFLFCVVCIRIGILERIIVNELEKIYEGCYSSGRV